LVDVKVTKFVNPNKLNKFICKIEIEFEDKRFSDFITNERAKKYLHYYIKESFIKKIFRKNPFKISIVGYNGNSYREDLKPFICNIELFEFFSFTEREQFFEAVKSGLNQYFEYAQSLYERKMFNV
jgi:hypothetical protein